MKPVFGTASLFVVPACQQQFAKTPIFVKQITVLKSVLYIGVSMAYGIREFPGKEPFTIRVRVKE